VEGIENSQVFGREGFFEDVPDLMKQSAEPWPKRRCIACVRWDAENIWKSGTFRKTACVTAC